MPYITQDKRDAVDDQINYLINAIDEATENTDEQLEGNLNYIITRLVQHYYGSSPNDTRYFKIARAVGMLTNVKDEFYRKVAAPYEELAELKNGPIKK